MAADDPKATSNLRRTVASYVRRLIRVGLAAQTFSSAGATSLAISSLLSSAVGIASQLQRAIVVRVVGAPLVRRRPRRRSGGEVGEEYPEPGALASGETAGDEEQGTEWEEVAPASVALADLEVQPFTIARMLPSMVLAHQSAFQPLASVNAAVARAVGTLGVYPASRPEAPQTAFGIGARAPGEAVTPGTGPVSQASVRDFPADVRELPSSTSFGVDSPRDSTAGGATGTRATSEVPSRPSPSRTSIDSPSRGSLAPSPSAVASSAGEGAGHEPGTAAGDQASTQFSPAEQRQPTSQTSFEATSRAGPYAPQDAAPASTGGQFTALGVLAAFRSAASSIVFDLNSAARETTNATLGSQALGTTFSAAAPRPSGAGTDFQPGPSTTGQSPSGASSAGTADTTFVSTPSAAQNLGLPSGAPTSLGQSPSPTASSGLGAVPTPQTSPPTLSTASATTGPAPTQASASAPSGIGSLSGQAAASPQSPPSGPAPSFPVARAGPVSSLSAAVNAGTGPEQEATAVASVRPSGVAGPIDGTSALPTGLGTAFSTQAVEQATRLSLQVGAFASPATSPTLPLRAGGESSASNLRQNLGMAPRAGLGPYVAGAAFSLSVMAASLGLAGPGPSPSDGIPPARPVGAHSLELSPAQEVRSAAAFALDPTVASAGLGAAEASPPPSGQGEPVLASSEEGSSEARELGARLGASANKRPRFAPSELLFGERWLATIAAASAMGGSLFDLLGFPGYSAPRFLQTGTAAGRTASGLPSGTVEAFARAGSLQQLGALSGVTASPASRESLPGRPSAAAEEIPLRTGEVSSLPGREAPSPGARPDYPPSGLPAPGTRWSEWRATDQSAPSPSFGPQETLAVASRSVWARATLLPGILTPASTPITGQGYRSSRQDLSQSTSFPREEAEELRSLGLPLIQRSYALAAADLVRRTVLAASAGPLGARRTTHLSRSSWLARARVAALGERTASAAEAGAEGVVSTPGREGQLFGVGAEAGAHEGFLGTSPGLHLEATRLPSVVAALTSAARLRASLVLPRAAIIFPDQGTPSSSGGPSVLSEGLPRPVPGSPALGVGPLAEGGLEEAPSAAGPGPTKEWGAGDFFGLEAVTRALSLASRLPSASQFGGVAFIPPRPAAAPARVAAQKPVARRGQAAEVEFAPDRPPEATEPWRSAPENAISEVLSDATTRRRPRSEEPEEESDDRELRKKIEKMIDEELRRYGYQP